MTLFYPDISAFQAGVPLTGAAAAAVKITEGTGWLSADWLPALARAAKAGCWPFGYHFLHQGSAAAQAAWCYAHAAKTPVMLDWEATVGSEPGVGDATGFIDAFRAAGGICNLVYLPRWYWAQIGSPNLGPFAQRGCHLVSSAYPGAYSDSGEGWAAYGGMTPAVWQYTNKQSFNGRLADFNAFKGTAAELEALVTGGQVPAAEPVIRLGSAGPAVTLAQQRLNAWGASPKLAADGQFGPATLTAVQAFQRARGLTADGVAGPATWGRLLASPAPPVLPSPAPAPGYTGQFTCDGTLSLAAAAAAFGRTPEGLLASTAAHYGSLDTGLGAGLGSYAGGVLTGAVAASAPLPRGAVIWCA